MAKYENFTYHKGSFHGVSNIDINVIKCEENIVIPSKIQNYVLHWYHTYILHPGMDRTEATIFQHFYWSGIRHAVRKEVNNCDNYQRTKQSNIKYVKLTAKEAEEMPWNKLCVDLIGPYVVRKRERNKIYI